ncbi:MAG: S-adenosyl-L-methionine-dependent methyltransferase [Monoraphidium minutum]|nr:MAG: S-adenosyl-L-methionine-dependent methyltransferase [Monoraphidium minutum]
MAGSGVRAARYISQAGADFVWSNDLDHRNQGALIYNTVSAMADRGAPPEGAAGPGAGAPPAGDVGGAAGGGARAAAAAAWAAAAGRLAGLEGLRGEVLEWSSGGGGGGSGGDGGGGGSSGDGGGGGGGGVTCRVSRVDANRLLASRYLAEDFYDLVDVDSFGSETSHLPSAIDAVKYGGMLFLTSTDGISSGGKRPERSLAAYGAYLRSLPFSNEQGLRMLVGAAVREAAARGVVLRPLFSYYSFHG